MSNYSYFCIIKYDTLKQFSTIRLLFILPIIILSSCNKEVEVPDTDTLAAVDNAHAETLFIDASLVCDEAGYYGGPFTAVLSSACATVSYDSLNTSDADTITIDFGTANCMCTDSSTRRGKMTAIYTGNYADSGSTRTVTFTDYYTNDDRLNGSFVVTNEGADSISGNTIFHINVTGSIVLSEGGQINWNSNEDIEWTTGESTSGWYDNQYLVRGTAYGTVSAGDAFASQIYQPLRRVLSAGCRKHFTQGILQVKPGGKAIRSLEFGSGTCDNFATVAIDGTMYSVLLR